MKSPINTIFIDAKTDKILDEFPDEFDQDELFVGNKIRVHLFIGGWKTYKITRVNEGKEYWVYVKKCLFC